MILDDTPLATSQYLTVLVRNDVELRRYEKQYIYFLANQACSENLCQKMLSRSAGGAIYASYFTSGNAVLVEQVLDQAVRLVATQRTVRFGSLARVCFGREKGAYYWAKSACDHLVYLGLARHETQNGIGRI